MSSDLYISLARFQTGIFLTYFFVNRCDFFIFKINFDLVVSPRQPFLQRSHSDHSAQTCFLVILGALRVTLDLGFQKITKLLNHHGRIKQIGDVTNVVKVQ